MTNINSEISESKTLDDSFCLTPKKLAVMSLSLNDKYGYGQWKNIVATECQCSIYTVRNVLKYRNKDYFGIFRKVQELYKQC